MFGTDRKVLPQGIHTCNMKALSLLVQMLKPMFSLFKSRSDVKVKVTRSNFLVRTEMYCHKEPTYVISKPHLYWLNSYN